VAFNFEKLFQFPAVFRRVVCFGLMLTLSVTFISAQSQDKTQNKKPADDDDVIKFNSNLVNVDVTVRDKKGKPVRDLKPEDFVISENGVKQTIEFFDATLVTDSSTKEAEPGIATTETSTQRTLPRNVIALVLDGQTTEATNLKPVREGIVKFIKDRITTEDSTALFAIAGGLQLLQPFTNDKQQLTAAVEGATHLSVQNKTVELRDLQTTIDSLRNQLAAGPTGPITSAAGGSAAAQAMISRRVLEEYLQLRSTLSVQQTRPILAALAAICEGLRPIRGKKTLVMFSQGFVAPEVLDWQVQSTIDIANRANVSIYIIDSSGLKGGVPQSGALVPSGALAGISAAVDQESRIRASAGQSIFDISRQEGIDRQQDLLFRISEDTGGHFIRNTNDFSSGLNRIDDEIRARYTLAYRSTDQNFDGQFRKVRIQVRRPDVNVVTRPGYYAIPPTQIIPFSPDERKMMASFSSLETSSTLPMSVELNAVRAKDGFYVVPLLFDVPPQSVTFQEQAGKRRLQLDVLGLVRKEGDEKILSRLGGNFNVELTGEQYQSILNDKIFYRQDIELEPGSYTIELMVKDRVSGRAAARREKIVLPNADDEFFASRAVLSRTATAAIPSLSNSNDAFSVGNIQIRPSPSHQFRAADNLIIFFRIYNAAQAPDTKKARVRVTVNLERDGKLATKPFEFELSETTSDPVPHLPFAKFVKLTGLPPGKYRAVIESKDMIKQKVLTQDVWFEILQ
jgi:VWFA-related protein